MQRSTTLRSLYRTASKAGGRPSRGPAPRPIGLLVGGLGDGRGDAASAQVAANRAAGVSLVGQDPTRPGTGTPAPASLNADAVHHRVEHDRIVALAGRDDPGDRPTPAVRGEVNLRGQPTAGMPQSFSIMVVVGALVIR
jgi:hypothetical protein